MQQKITYYFNSIKINPAELESNKINLVEKIINDTLFQINKEKEQTMLRAIQNIRQNININEFYKYDFKIKIYDNDKYNYSMYLLNHFSDI